jgi:hypothetical protein
MPPAEEIPSTGRGGFERDCRSVFLDRCLHILNRVRSGGDRARNPVGISGFFGRRLMVHGGTRAGLPSLLAPSSEMSRSGA